VHAFCR